MVRLFRLFRRKLACRFGGAETLPEARPAVEDSLLWPVGPEREKENYYLPWNRPMVWALFACFDVQHQKLRLGIRDSMQKENY